MTETNVILCEIDAYGGGKGGYGINLEGSIPSGLHIVCTVFSREWMRSHEGLVHAEKVTDQAHFRAVLAWLGQLRAPAKYNAIPREVAEMMALSNPPGHGAPGTEHFLWKGGDWRERCPLLLGADVQVVLAEALPENEELSMPMLIETWRSLAAQIQAGPIGDKPFSDEPGKG